MNVLLNQLQEKFEHLEKKIPEITAASAAATGVNNIPTSTTTKQQVMLATAASLDPRVHPPLPGIATAPHLAFCAYRYVRSYRSSCQWFARELRCNKYLKLVTPRMGMVYSNAIVIVHILLNQKALVNLVDMKETAHLTFLYVHV